LLFLSQFRAVFPGGASKASGEERAKRNPLYPYIAAAVSALKQKGVHFEPYGMPTQDSEGVWTAPGGAKIAWFKDPDGNILSLTQFP
jgi:hypothetical protein